MKLLHKQLYTVPPSKRKQTKRGYFVQVLLAACISLLLVNPVNAQVNGFTLSCPGTTQVSGSSFPVNVSFNWTLSTTSATATINYNPAMVSYDASCQSVLPACMSITNNPTTGVLTITISNLSSCTNTGAISFNVCFRFNCPDTCAGVNKTAVFNGTLTDNLSTTQNANCSTTGNTPNNWTLLHNFHSYNSLTAEVTYKAYYYNPTCFRVNNPSFNVALTPSLCGGTITSAWGLNYTYSIAGSTITPNATPAFNQYNWDTLYYVVKLPCNTCLNQTLTSNITLRGENCAVPNSVIKGPVAASFLIPVAPAALPGASVQKWVYTSPNRFRTRITNTGNTPLNLQHDEFIPLVHVTNAPSVLQYTNQSGISNTVQYFNCSNVPGSTYPLIGHNVNDVNAPANTTKIRQLINGLLPGNYVELYTYFNLASSCSGPVGNPPYRDSSVITYNCVAPPVTCISCTPGTGTTSAIVIYNPQPILQCVSSTYISQCKSVGDTLDFCFEFRNVGDAPLLAGIFNAGMPNWLQFIPGSETYTGFSPNPTYIPSTNANFNLPTIPVGSNVYKICFKAVVNSGAVGGTNWFWTTATGSNLQSPLYVCYSNFNICAYAAIGIDKKVKGSLDATFGSSGNGLAGTMATYEVTLRNTGTIAVNNLVVIDRLPSSTPADLTILGSPSSTPRGSQFNMTPGATPVITGATVTYSNNPNVCTGWTGVGAPCGPPAVATWTGGVKAMRVVWNSSVVLAPGATLTFTFQAQIPNATAAGLHACNTAGFNATSVVGGYTINPVESPNVCIEVKPKDPPPPEGCCKDLLKNIKSEHTVSNDIINVNLTMAAGPKKIKKVTVSLVKFEVNHPADCDVCVRDPKLFGNIVPAQNSLPWTTVPLNVPFTHMIQWNDSAGQDWSSGKPANFTIPLPPRSPIACCCDTIDYCLRYTFVDEDCNTCDTIICYRVYNGKDCKESGTGTGGGNEHPEDCKCSFKPLFQYEGNGQAGSKNINCNDAITLFKGNIFTSIIPNFECKDANGKDCAQGPVTVTIKKPDNTTQVLTGPTFNYSYTGPPGTYEYTMVGTCGGKKCECKFRVIIPQN